MNQESVPLKFVGSLFGKKHTALLYDDEEHAQRIEFEFLKTGLKMGDSCIFATDMDPGLVILKMINSGIPVMQFLKKKSPHISNSSYDRQNGGTDKMRKKTIRKDSWIFKTTI